MKVCAYCQPRHHRQSARPRAERQDGSIAETGEGGEALVLEHRREGGDRLAPSTRMREGREHGKAVRRNYDEQRIRRAQVTPRRRYAHTAPKMVSKVTDSSRKTANMMTSVRKARKTVASPNPTMR
jgi:hypothetical protein